MIDFNVNEDFSNKIRFFLMKNEIFNSDKQIGLSTNDHRQLTFDRLELLLSSGLLTKEQVIDNPSNYFTLFNELHLIDNSLAVKLGVHIGLFGSAIYNLGTKKHHTYLDKLISLEVSGCFAMTELNHGSNVIDIETTAIYNHSSQTFVINTPHDGAQKYWIGNAALHGNTAVVFAQLLIPITGDEIFGSYEQEYTKLGVHAFIVPIRKEGKICANVHIEDCGEKEGLNGVDNGRMWFNNVEIKYDNLLDRYGHITKKGEYKSDIKNIQKRFTTMLSSLVGGRIALTTGATYTSRLALTIALKYALQRRQFKAPGVSKEILIMDYRLHQLKLIPLLAETYANTFVSNYLISQYHLFHKKQLDDEQIKELHILSSGFKVYSTEHALKTCLECRKCCGGFGYSMHNRFGGMIADLDIYRTFEGDNTVLSQQVCQHLLTELKNKLRSSFSQYMYYLKYSLVKYVNDKSFNVFSILDALNYREKYKTMGVASNFKDATLEGWNEIAPFAMEMTSAFIEKKIYEIFVKNMETEHHHKLATLLGLVYIEKDMVFFIKSGYYSSSYHNDVKSKIHNLCGELRNDIPELLNEMNIPPKLVNAFIANDLKESKFFVKSKL
jgi:acyl-CoA oxidase